VVQAGVPQSVQSLDYCLDDRDSIPGRWNDGIFSSPPRSGRLWSIPNLLSNGYRGLGTFHGVKAVGAWSWPLTFIQCHGTISPLPIYVLMVWRLIKQDTYSWNCALLSTGTILPPRVPNCKWWAVMQGWRVLSNDEISPIATVVFPPFSLHYFRPLLPRFAHSDTPHRAGDISWSHRVLSTLYSTRVWAHYHFIRLSTSLSVSFRRSGIILSKSGSQASEMLDQ
jgi:hypothetical protein